MKIFVNIYRGGGDTMTLVERFILEIFEYKIGRFLVTKALDPLRSLYNLCYRKNMPLKYLLSFELHAQSRRSAAGSQRVGK